MQGYDVRSAEMAGLEYKKLQFDKKIDSYYSMNPHIIIAGQFTGYGI